MTPTPFEVYKTYVALKMHFTSDYDYFKYNGKVKAESTSFETRKDKYHFYKMSKRKDWFNYILSNLVVGESWIGNMLTPEGEQRHVEWSKRIQSLGYQFARDIGQLRDQFNDNFTVEDNTHPFALRLYLRKHISLETLIILDSLAGIFKHWDKKLENDPMWKEVGTLASKYRKFVSFDHAKMKEIVLTRFPS